MLKVIMCVGIPASGKSTWAKEQLKSESDKWKRINRDDLRAMVDNSVYSANNEKLIMKFRNFILKESLLAGKNVILDDTNLNKRNFDDVCDLVKSLCIDCTVIEKSFYIDLQEAIDRDSKRTGSAHVGEEVIKKFWKQSGGKQHAFYKPRIEVFTKNSKPLEEAKPFDPKKQSVVITDLDGTLAEISHRDPYDASNCDQDGLNEPVARIITDLRDKGYKLVFLSGRMDKFEKPTRIFLDKHIGGEYELYMRKTNDSRKDSVIKEELYNEHIKDKYNVFCVFDDRLSVCRLWFQKLKLFLFRVGDPDSSF